MPETEPLTNGAAQPNRSEELFGSDLTISEVLKRIRKRLLDLTSRNRLLNFRWSKGRVLRIIETVPDDLYLKLLDDKKLTFSYIPDPSREEYEREGETVQKPDVKRYAESLGINTSYELPSTSTQEYASIQTLHYPEDLERILRKIHQTARTAIEESGTNMLYLVFGFLEWYESNDAETPFYAPLLSMPVSLERGRVDHETGYYRYSVSYSGEDISDNITLREKLRNDFSIELPEFEEDDTPERYFIKLKELIRTRHRWKVQRQVTLTLLSFGKLLMWLDLDTARWPQNKPLDRHPLILSLNESVQLEDLSNGIMDESPIDEDLSDRDLPIIFDADSSQHDVLVDALNHNKNLVVEGPPGTGKSQTITNLIAAALTKGRTVLFVSEKLAALEVVRRNLDKAGLGVFCLELHSHRTQKKKLLEDIKSRIDQRGNFRDPAKLEGALNDLKVKRQALKRYADTMNSSLHNNLGLTVHQVLWAAERYRMELKEKFSLLSAVEVPAAAHSDQMKFSEMEGKISQFSRHLSEIGCHPHEHPWYGFYPYRMIYGDEAVIVRLLEELIDGATELIGLKKEAREERGLELPEDQDAQGQLFRNVRNDIPAPSGTEAFDLLPGLYIDHAITIIKSFEEKFNAVRTYEAELVQRLRNPDEIDEEDITAATEAKERAVNLNHAGRPLHEITGHGEYIEALGKELNKALEFYSSIMETIGTTIPPTKNGLGLLTAILKGAGSAPLDLLDYRRPQFADPSMIRTIREAIVQANHIRQMRNSLEETFILTVIPSREELSQAIRICTGSSGVMRIFSRDWHKTKRLYKGICKHRKPFIRPDHCAQNLSALLEYFNLKASFEGNTGYQQALGDLFSGIDTDFKKIEKVLEWYQSVTVLFTLYNIDINNFMALPAGTMTKLLARSAEVENHWSLINSLDSRIKSIFENAGTQEIPDLEQVTIDVLRDHLFEISASLKNISKAFESLTDSKEISPAEVINLLYKLLEVRRYRREIEEDQEAKTYLGHRYQGLETDWAPILALLAWCEHLRNAHLPEEIERWIICPKAVEHLDTLREYMNRSYECWKSLYTIISRLGQFGNFDLAKWLCGLNKTAQNIATRAQSTLAHRDRLPSWVDFSRSLYAADKLGLRDITSLALDGRLDPEEVKTAFRYCFYNSIARTVFRHTPELLEFSGLSQEEVRKRFEELDREVIRLTAERCAHSIDRRPIPQGDRGRMAEDYTDLYLIEREINKRRRHIPIRQLVNRAGAALQALKPCFMMGPLSVAQYLGPGRLEFDLIVMDEASQLPPEEAIGAIARGKQMVVVGDPKQLPPTSFFNRLLGETDSPEEEETAMEGMESILDVCLSSYHYPRRLKWHYRSQHQSLIAFSNKHFYDNTLIIFPSPQGHDKGLGLRHHYVANAVYDKNRNHEEAKQIADAIINHFLKNPDESLGVVTLNIYQRDLIQDEVERRLKYNPDAEVFLGRWEKEYFPFFVKNLENVQGDERDVIFISTTFGRNPQGVVYKRFGPINQEMGWRRLNVLFTRARRRIELFTSMQPEDIIVDASDPRGVKSLRDYLHYVKHGILDQTEPSERPPDSDFEIAVAEVLKDQGYEVVPQLGVANFYIDIAVKNPFNRNEFLAAIECDGATYHSARSVRERDRLRQEILERIGWNGKIYRIWSTDWFKDPRTQIRRLLAFLDHLRQKAQKDVAAQPAVEPQYQVTTPISGEKISTSTMCVEVGDFVTYCDVEKPDERKSIQIIRGHGDTNLGTIGVNVPLAQALLGTEVGDEVELNVPGRPRRLLRIIDIER